MYRRARYLLGNDDDAREATQEVFIRAMKAQRTFEARAGVHTWLYRITTNYCLNVLRDRKRRKELWEENMSDSGQAVPFTQNVESVMLLRRLLSEAEAQQARVAVYVLVDGMSHSEAARYMKVSRRTVGNLLERFKKWAEARILEEKEGE